MNNNNSLDLSVVESAVDHGSLARDVARFGAGEEEHGGGDLRRPSGAAKGNHGVEHLADAFKYGKGGAGKEGEVSQVPARSNDAHEPGRAPPSWLTQSAPTVMSLTITPGCKLLHLWVGRSIWMCLEGSAVSRRNRGAAGARQDDASSTIRSPRSEISRQPRT